MRKGVVVLIPFPFTDLSGMKVRPAVILRASAHTEDCIVAFISSAPLKRKRAFNVELQPSKQNGLKTKSYIKLDKLATLQKGIVLGELGNIDNTTMQNIDMLLKKLFSL